MTARPGDTSKARSGSARETQKMLFKMHYVYLLKSLKNNDIYVGFSSNLKTRFKSHNAGKVKSTKGYRPWILIYYEAYKAKTDATKREKQLKMHAAKSDLIRRLKNSLMVK